MTRNTGIGLMICALVFVALAGPGYAAEATIQANAEVKGEGRFYRATKATEGEGRCLFLTQDGTHAYGSWTCTGKAGAGCAGTFKVLGGTGRFNNASGQGDFTMTSTLTEMTITIPEGGVTGVTANFTGKLVWPSFKLTTK